MEFTVPLNWMLIGGALALVGASILAGAVVWCTVYAITVIAHGIIRAVRHRNTKEEDRP